MEKPTCMELGEPMEDPKQYARKCLFELLHIDATERGVEINTAALGAALAELKSDGINFIKSNEESLERKIHSMLELTHPMPLGVMRNSDITFAYDVYRLASLWLEKGEPWAERDRPRWRELNADQAQLLDAVNYRRRVIGGSMDTEGGWQWLDDDASQIPAEVTIVRYLQGTEYAQYLLDAALEDDHL